MSTFLFIFLLTLTVLPLHDVNGQINTFFRRDYFLDDSLYPEGLPDPNTGGRFHLIMPTNKENNTYPIYSIPFTVSFNGLKVKIDPSTVLPNNINWIYCDYQQTTGQIWVSAHIPNDDILDKFDEFLITDSTGMQMAKYSNVKFVHSGLQLYYVTVRILDDNTQQIIMHFYCYYNDTAFDIAKLYLNGNEIDQDIPVAALQHTVVTYNNTISELIKSGDIYTIRVVLKDGLEMGFGGRYTNPLQKYPIVASVIDSQCPYPDTNNTNYNILTNDLAMNSMYLSSNTTCNQSNPFDVIKYYNNNWNDTETVNYNSLLLETSLSSNNTLIKYNNLDDIVSALTVYENIKPLDENAVTVNTSYTIQQVWKESLKRRLLYPSSMTVVNSMTNHEVGTYSGITDYQCSTFFMFGCRPTSLTQNNYYNTFPITAVYDYLRNARLNHMPLPIWGAIQLFSDWEGGGYLTSSEITLSIGQAIASGVHGVHVVAADITQQITDSDGWKSAMNLMASIQYLESKGLMKIASADGTVINNGNTITSLWSALRTINELIVIGVNLNCNGYNPAKCSSTNTEHWTCFNNKVKIVNMTIPPDWISNNLKVNVLEIISGQTKQPSFNISLEYNYLIFYDVNLNANDTTRIFLVSKS